MATSAGTLHADVFRINDRVIAIYNEIAVETAIRDHATIGASLRTESSVLQDAFQRYDALSADRARDLSEVEGELVRAAAAAKAGDRAGVYSALIRAHGRINSAIGDFMTKQA